MQGSGSCAARSMPAHHTVSKMCQAGPMTAGLTSKPVARASRSTSCSVNWRCATVSTSLLARSSPAYSDSPTVRCSTCRHRVAQERAQHPRMGAARAGGRRVRGPAQGTP